MFSGSIERAGDLESQSGAADKRNVKRNPCSSGEVNRIGFNRDDDRNTAGTVSSVISPET